MQLAARPRAAFEVGAELTDDIVPDLESTVSDDSFAARMARFAPFEKAPTIAVGVSGGRDSMCLALLASRWVGQRGGEIIALTVDHGLRPDSADEACQVGEWLRGYGIHHHVLRWDGPYPVSGLQAAARAARYRLLGDYCRDYGILHLLVAHHREDQAETVMIRRARDSGRDGLAAMAAVREQPHMRVLRPLLEVSRDCLTATLVAGDQKWVDDPSNDNTAMARGRLRAEGGDMSVAAALTLAQESAQARKVAEQAVAALAARALRFHPGGFVSIDRAVLAAAAPDIVERLLARTVMAVAGRAYPPRGERTRRLQKILIGAASIPGNTLGGCQVVGHQNLLVVCREPARIGPPVGLTPGVETLWDNRFAVSVTKSLGGEYRLDALTATGWAQIVSEDSQLRTTSFPYVARLGLPTVWRANRVVLVPHMGFVNAEESLKSAGLRLAWRPQQPVSPAFFGKV